jgi:hypothetical protein
MNLPRYIQFCILPLIRNLILISIDFPIFFFNERLYLNLTAIGYTPIISTVRLNHKSIVFINGANQAFTN